MEGLRNDCIDGRRGGGGGSNPKMKGTSGLRKGTFSA